MYLGIVNQPPPAPQLSPEYQALQDAEHIKLLVIFHYILAGVLAVIACIPIIHVLMGFFMMYAASRASTAMPADDAAVMQSMSWVFVLVGCAVIITGWVFAFLVYLSGRYLSRRENHTFIFVIACICCLQFPFGTALGVFTIIVLQRPSVKRLFEDPTSAIGSI